MSWNWWAGKLGGQSEKPTNGALFELWNADGSLLGAICGFVMGEGSIVSEVGIPTAIPVVITSISLFRTVCSELLPSEDSCLSVLEASGALSRSDLLFLIFSRGSSWQR